MVTDVIRIYPEGLSYEGLACFRMEIIGCDPNGDLKILWPKNSHQELQDSIPLHPPRYLEIRCTWFFYDWISLFSSTCALIKEIYALILRFKTHQEI